jgi:tRNA threonylcarbamoyladenosine biosynthesis protein TsaB
MAKILLIDTSSEVCSAAISVDGEILKLSENLETQSHASLLTLQIEECSQLANVPLAQLDAVALSQGPGAYTALRVGASVAKGICYALEKPLIAVNTLHALAYASREAVENLTFLASDSAPKSHNLKSEIQGQMTTVFAPMLDARRQEIWLALYDADLREIAPAQPLILENNSFEKFILAKTGGNEIHRIVLSGNGMEKTRSGLILKGAVLSTVVRCSARHLAMLAEHFFQKADFQDIAYFEPHYMKPPNITISSKPMF